MARTSLRFDKKEFETRVQNFFHNLSIFPKNFEIYTQAFVHKSVLNEASHGYPESNERLEFLGDAILELTITEKLFQDFPTKGEGHLTDIRSAIVRGRNLANVAVSLGVSEVIQLSRGEFRVAGHENPYILANAMEAIIGAIYLDFGFDIAKNWILKYIYTTLPDILERGLYVDPKSYLQEVTQEVWGILPVYMVHSEEGEDHNKTYVIHVYLGEQNIGIGRGTSKKKGEQDAAENAIMNRKTWESTIMVSRKK